MEIIDKLLFLTTFILGYYMGLGRKPEVYEKAIKMLQKAHSKTRLGAVSHPTARDIAKKSDRLYNETEEAMSETLSKYIDPGTERSSQTFS